MASLPDDLSTTQLLAAAESGVRAQRAMEVEQLRVVLAWCDRHGEDPRRCRERCRSSTAGTG
ncbi:hypothetical protein [Nocardioides sambongensis]|uniref:hypothetical protein n=1 Tax=Nocardioides sambongensis TaxID=2589074 RepID=UPI001129FD23|nr:hypothetical protein [Nocardioides sambongensis]